LQAAAEGPRVVGLDDEMEMVLLDTALRDPETVVGGGGERAADGREDPAGAQAADGPSGAEGDMCVRRGR
jgi:hypothetical protein